MANKDRTLVVLKYLQDHTNLRTTVSTKDIRSEVERNGLHTNVLTIRRDVKAMRDAGYDVASIEQNGVLTQYYYVDRVFDAVELEILVDAVASAQFLSPDKSRELIRKMQQYAGPGYEGELEPFIAMSGRNKAPNDLTLIDIQEIRRAIQEEKRISFLYMVDDVERGRIPKHEGHRYQVSPYATVWKEDRYYLVGWSEKHGDVATFRIDRIESLKVLKTARRDPPESYNLQDYVDKAFRMYGTGPEETVILRCRKYLYGHILDRFGDRAKAKAIDEEWMDVTADVFVNDTFFGWLHQYVRDMKLIAPESAVEAYRKRLREALKATEY